MCFLLFLAPAPTGQVLLENLVGIFHRAAAIVGIKLLPAEWVS